MPSTDLSPEEQLFVMDIKSEFESDGVHLSTANKQSVLQMKAQLLQMESAYMQTISHGGVRADPDVEVTIGTFSSLLSLYTIVFISPFSH